MTIREWLSNPSDFNTGLKLYEKYGSSGSLKRIMHKSGDTHRNRETLLYELGKLIDIDTNPPKPMEVYVPMEVHEPVAQKKGEIKNFIIPEPEIVYNPDEEQDTPPVIPVPEQHTAPAGELLQLETEWKDLYKQSAFKHNTLESMSPEDRRSAAHFILNSFDRIHELWGQLDHYKAHGQLPPKEVIKAPSTDPIALFQRKKTLSTYISKAKKGVQYVDPDRIPEWEKEIQEIDKILNAKK